MHLRVLLTPLCVIALVGAARGEETASPCEGDSPDALQISVLYRHGTQEGSSHREGTEAACAAHLTLPGSKPVLLSMVAYTDEPDGFETLASLLEEGRTHLILGPTDSGVFRDAIEFIPKTESAIPVVSSLVATSAGNDPEGWFFRTNVGVVARVRQIYDYLSAKGVESIAILYARREFGQIAEATFQEELTDAQRQRYVATRFDGEGDARRGIRQILVDRPAGVGVFGSRAEVNRIRDLLKRQRSSWNSYAPYFFTIVDARSLRAPDLLFLSVLPGRRDLARDEAFGLAYDTTQIVLSIHDQISARPGSGEWRLDFRRRMRGILSSSPARRDSMTGMRFGAYENLSEPVVMQVVGDRALALTGPDRESTVGTECAEGLLCTAEAWLAQQRWGGPLLNWLEIRKRRFGEAPVVNLSIVVFVVMLLTVLDLKFLHRVHGWDWLSLRFLLLILFNAGTALMVFVLCADNGVLRWDDPIGAFIVSFGYTGILKTNFGDKASAIGISPHYDRIVGWLNKGVRQRKFETQGPVINFIAFANAKTFLQRALIESYSFARDRETSERFQNELQSELDAAADLLAKRRLLAVRALDEMSWSKMITRRILPAHAWRRTLPDPEAVLCIARDHVMEAHDEAWFGKLHREVRAGLEKFVRTREEEPDAETRTADSIVEFDTEFEEAQTAGTRFDVCLRWWILQRRFDLRALHTWGFLPDDYDEQLRGRMSVVERSLLAIHRRLHPDLYVAAPRPAGDLPSEADEPSDAGAESPSRVRVASR